MYNASFPPLYDPLPQAVEFALVMSLVVPHVRDNEYGSAGDAGMLIAFAQVVALASFIPVTKTSIIRIENNVFK